MRAGFSNTLLARLNREPAGARQILRIKKNVAQDVIDTKAEWNEANSLTGVTLLEDEAGAGVRITGTGATHFDQSTQLAGADITSMPNPVGASSIDVVYVQWSTDNIEITAITAYLNPDVDTLGADVDKWALQPFRVHAINYDNEGQEVLDLTPLANRVEVIAGASAGDVTFNLQASVPVGRPPIGDVPGYPLPLTIIAIWAIDANGANAGNVAWVADSGNSDGTFSTHYVARRTLTRPGSQSATGISKWVAASASGLPDVLVSGRTYSSQTVTFTTNDIDLGAAPASDTKLEVVAVGQEFAGTLTFQIDDGVAGWTTVKDGDIIGEDLTGANPPGSDLSGLLRQQNYDMRVTLAPAGTWQTPIARRMGVRELAYEVVDGIASIGETSYGFDPLTGRAEIPEVEIDLSFDGRRDYLSFVEDLFTTYHIGELELDVMIGHPDLARGDWGHVDTFIIDDYTVSGSVVRLYCVSPLSLALATIPAQSGGTRTAVSYVAQTDKAIYDDLVGSQLAIGARFIGPGVTNVSETRTKVIRGPVKAIEEVYRIAFLAGGSVISSQGRIKYVDLFSGVAEPDERAHFDAHDIEILGISPGYRTRITEYNVGYGWSDSRGPSGDFQGTAFSQAQANIRTNLGRALIDINETLDEETAKYIEDSADAQLISDRMIAFFSSGMASVRFRSFEARPYLEPGDPITIETDEFVGRDPNSGNAIRGPMTYVGKIHRCHDLIGREFTAWLKLYTDVQSTASDVTHSGYSGARVLSGAGITVAADPITGEMRVNYEVPAAGGGDTMRPSATASQSNFPVNSHTNTGDNNTGTGVATVTNTTTVCPTTTDSSFEVAMSNPTNTPTGSETITLRVHAQKVEDIGTGHTVDLTAELREAGNTLATRTASGISTTGAWVVDSVLSAAEKGAVTDWDAVQVFVKVTECVASGGDEVHSQVNEIEITFS